jgi:transaldolase
MMTQAIRGLVALGQSVWLDDLRREYLRDGALERLITDDGLSGVTSNPAIFERAIDSSNLYDADIENLLRQGASAQQIYESLAVSDVRAAADLLGGSFERSAGRDGFVSLEVSPCLAHDTAATIEEALRLWSLVERPNLLVKVPATEAGLPAIRALTARAINVNVTLLFSVSRYRAVLDAFMGGLEERIARGETVDGVMSVASFFLSRIDTLVDRQLDEIGTSTAAALRGSSAVASAKLAHAECLEQTSSPRWQALAAHGAQIQRLLWASTGTKDSAYGDIKYVEALIAPQTIVTMPLATLEAYRDHGRPAIRISDELDEARSVPAKLAAQGIDLESVARELEGQGVRKFADPFDVLLKRLEQRAVGRQRGTAGPSSR